MKKYLVLILLSIVCLAASAQKQANYWYFGDHAGVNFGLGIPVALTNGALSTGEGCSSISTASGNLEFYTDGRFVYDRNHNQMPNGNGLLGHSSSTQSGIIVPKPLSTSQYYIFTVDAYDNNLANGLCYSRVDMTLNNGMGDVVVSEKNISLVPLTCEKVTAVGHSDGVSFWVITHKWGNDEFYAYKITSSGVNLTPVISNAGAPVLGDMQASKGYIKVSPDGTKIAMANNTAFSVGIFNFNNTTGVVTHLVTDNNYINPGGWDPGGPYGVEFSPNGTLLYIGEWKANRKIYQYDLSSNDPTTILNSKTMVASVGQGADPIGALQLGPDNRLYIARQNSPYLSRINQPNVVGNGCGFVDNAVNLGGRECTYGLPPFIQSFFYLTADYYYDTPVCYGTPTQFYTSASDNPDSVFWNFGDPASGDANTSTLLNPVHHFTSPGIYSVTLTVYLYGQAKGVWHLVIVRDTPEVYLGNDTTLCSNEPFIIDADTGHAHYLWQNGDTTQTFAATSPGWYWCQVFNEYGCSDLDSIYVNINPLPIADAGADQMIPSGTSTTLLGSASAGSGNFSYSWTPANLLVNPSVAQPVTQNLYGTALFNLTVTDNNGGCVDEDEVLVIVTGGVLACNPVATPDEICIGEQTQLQTLASGGSGVYTISWSSNPPGFSSDLPDPWVNPSVTTTYTVMVDDGFTQVTQSVTVTVYQLPIPEAGTDQSVPYGTPATLFGSASGGTGAYIYHWEPGNRIATGQNSPTPVTVNLTETTPFYLTVTDAQSGCVCTGPDMMTVNVTGVALHVNPSALPGTICAGETVQLSANAGGGAPTHTYSWKTIPPSVFTSTEANPVVNPTQTTTYEVSVYDGYNTVTGTISITVNPVPVIGFPTESTVCVFDIVTLDAGDPGPGSTYLWSNGSNERFLQVGATGIGFDIKSFSVEVTSPYGCTNSKQCLIYFDFSVCLGVDEGEAASSLFRIYPNPGNGLVKIENLGKPGNYAISVTGMSGVRVVDDYPAVFTETQNTITLDLSSREPGLYLFRITEDGNTLHSAKYLLTR